MRYNQYFRQVVFLIAIIVLSGLTGCLEVSEEIRVKESGEAKVTINLKGDMAEFSSNVALPTGAEWQIDTLEFAKKQDDTPEMTISAQRVVGAGKEFPTTFAQASDPQADKQLQFPTELRVWQEGNLTFYEFVRTYQARRHFRFVGGNDYQVDEDLEKRVMDQGIFNVSDSDRNEYLKTLALQFQLQMISFFEEASGELVRSGALKVDRYDSIRRRTRKSVEAMVTPESMLSIVSLPEDSMSVALDKLRAGVDSSFALIMNEETAGLADLDGLLRTALAKVNLEWGITEELGNDMFAIDIYLPGTLIKTNGKPHPDYPGRAGWEFEGNDLHDHSVGLYALSVVEH